MPNVTFASLDGSSSTLLKKLLVSPDVPEKPIISSLTVPCSFRFDDALDVSKVICLAAISVARGTLNSLNR